MNQPTMTASGTHDASSVFSSSGGVVPAMMIGARGRNAWLGFLPGRDKGVYQRRVRAPPCDQCMSDMGQRGGGLKPIVGLCCDGPCRRPRIGRFAFQCAA